MTVKDNPAVDLLARMLFGVTETTANYGGEETPDLAMDIVIVDESTVTSKVKLPSGDVYLVSIKWLEAESP